MSANGSITLVPSVHYSASHCRRVRRAIREADPDLVAVELDVRRFEYFDRDVDPSFADLARAVTPIPAAIYTAVRAIQRTIGRLYGLDLETTDMAVAIDTAAELDTDVALVDDPIEKTISGIASRVGPATIPRVLIRAARPDPGRRADSVAPLSPPLAEIEHGDDVQPAIDLLRRVVPELAEVVIDRRDRAMAERLHALRLEGYDVVAVLGVGHHNGVRRTLASLEGNEGLRRVTVPIRSPTGSSRRIPID
ncbi:TraB domain-containing protein [Natrialba swarupiae]|uniref:Conjugal transfer protein TraB n=1 Tax=Natrialba swarupiae TaxID=2448032 RepID=A0A5D5AMX5_9EURY|nr:conjugal transfer protein TraB [Natrialba swarupiae]TYT60451.1 conjugal transfer protein TraB [Natrialba swarupiae]